MPLQGYFKPFFCIKQHFVKLYSFIQLYTALYKRRYKPNIYVNSKNNHVHNFTILGAGNDRERKIHEKCYHFP